MSPPSVSLSMFLLCFPPVIADEILLFDFVCWRQASPEYLLCARLFARLLLFPRSAWMGGEVATATTES